MNVLYVHRVTTPPVSPLCSVCIQQLNLKCLHPLCPPRAAGSTGTRCICNYSFKSFCKSYWSECGGLWVPICKGCDCIPQFQKPGSQGVRKRDTASSTQETPKSAKPMPPAGSEQEPRSKVPTDQVSAGHSHVSDMLSSRAQPRFLHGELHGGLFASSPLTGNESKDDDYTKLLRTLHPWSAAYLTYIALIHQQRYVRMYVRMCVRVLGKPQ